MGGYFAVTAHWIEEPTPGKWELKTALSRYLHLVMRQALLDDQSDPQGNWLLLVCKWCGGVGVVLKLF
jgi:hypothetical protein